MGATNFSTVASGRTVADAYANAVRDARYWHGHGGYTGTIAEKSGWVEFTLPARVTAERFQRVAWDALYERDSERYERRDGKITKPGPNLATLVGWIGKHAADNLLDAVDDKWGPAVAVRLGATEGKQYVPKTPTGKRKTGYAAYLFFGMASC